MAYDPSALNVAVDTIGGGSLRIHGYRPVGESSEVFGTGYFTDAAYRGIRLGDIIVIITVTGAEIGTVSEITNGAATLTADQNSQHLTFSTQPSVANTKIPTGVNYITVLGRVEAGDHPPTRFKLKAVSPTVAPTNNLAWVIDKDGRYWINDESEIDARTLGVKGGTRTVETAGMTVGSFTLGATGAAFTSADEGKKVAVLGCGTLDLNYNKDSQLTATIVSVTNVNNVVLDVAAAQTASAQYCVIGWDDTIPILNACRAAATLGRWATLPAGDFITSSSVTGVVGYSFFKLKGAGLTATRMIFIALASPGVTQSQFAITGGLPAGTYLTTPAAAGTNTLVVNSVTGITAGNILVLSAKDQPQPNYAENYPLANIPSVLGDVARVRSVDIPSKTILLEGALVYSYTANPSALLQSAVQRCDVGVEPELRDMLLEHSSPSSNVGISHVAFSRVTRPRVENIIFKHTGGQCIALNSWIDGIANNINFSFVGGPDALDDDWGYGFSVAGFCWNVVISNIVAFRCRHALTSGGGFPNPGPHFVHVSQFLAYGCRINFDMHEGGRFWTFEDCHAGPGAVLLNVPTPESFGVGFQIRGWDCKVIGCTASGTQGGFVAAYTQNATFRDCFAENVDTGWNIISSPGTELIDCSIRGYRVTGVNAYRQSIALSAMPGLRFKGVTLYGNPTKQEVDDDQTKNFEPCAFQLGYWDTTAYPPGAFHSAYEDNWVFEDITIYDAHRRFQGLPSTSVVYGPLKQDTVLYESVPRGSLDATAIAALTSGVLHLTAIENVPKGLWVTKLGTMFGSAGTTQTNLWFTLWDRNMNFLGVTSDGTTTEPTPDVLTMFDVAVPFVTPYSGLYYHGIMAAGAAMPSVWGQAKSAAMSTIVPKLAGTSNTGLTDVASLPAISSATSTTSQEIGATGLFAYFTFTTQAGKAFTAGMPILISSNADPTVNFMRAYVLTYSSTTLVAEIYETGGSGVHTDWTITATAKATAITATANRLYAAVG